MNKLAKVLCAVATATVMVVPVAAQASDERPGTTAVDTSKKRCKSEEYVAADGTTKRRNRCAGGLFFSGAGLAGLGAGGAVVLGGVALGGIALAASSDSVESP